MGRDIIHHDTTHLKVDVLVADDRVHVVIRIPGVEVTPDGVWQHWLSGLP